MQVAYKELTLHGFLKVLFNYEIKNNTSIILGTKLRITPKLLPAGGQKERPRERGSTRGCRAGKFNYSIKLFSQC